jgi:D-glycero-D-manno-heptose 1,7-bisphosphate phosphatase
MAEGELMQVPVLYLDIDGTVRKGFDELGKFVNTPEDVEVFPEAVAKMQAWRKGGGRIVGITNQGGVGMGIVSAADVQENLQETQIQTGYLFDMIKVCVHKPDDGCGCRKPMTGLVLKAYVELGHKYPGETYPQHLALFVGDRPEDRNCAANAGIEFMDAKEWRAS